MHPLGRLLSVALVAVTAGGCVKLDSFSCVQSSECQDGDIAGSCEPGGLCSFPDPACASGKKFGEFAGEQSGQCVGDSGATSSPTTSPTTDPTEPGSTSTGPDFTSTSLDPTSTTTTSDPTVTTVTTMTATTLTTEPDTTTGPVCGQVGEACVDGACCGDCSTCDETNTCVPVPAEQGAQICGTCSSCGGDGNCTASPAETACTTDCSRIVWQERIEGSKTACYGYGAAAKESKCDGLGSCLPVDPIAAACPDPVLMPGVEVKLFECDSVCAQGSGLCVQGASADAIPLGAYCYLNSESPGCDTYCSDDMHALNVNLCDGQGLCAANEPQSCGLYKCDVELELCPDKCNGDAECFSNKCQGKQCQ